jgi:hypothetical protein
MFETAETGRPGWLLPPILAVLAIALQLAIDVPHHTMEPREDDEEIEAPPARTTAATRTPRPWSARGAAYVERLRNSWSARPISEEPVDPRFAAHHEELLRAVVRKAEAAVAPHDEPISVRTHATCHTIRCELEFCAPIELAEGIVEHLPKFMVGSQTLWHELREVESKRKPKRQQSCHRYVIDFAVEVSDPRSLRLAL